MGKYTLIRDISGTPTDGNIFAIPTKDIINGPLADIYDQYGQMWGHEGAGDWCLGGDPNFYEKLCEHLQDKMEWTLEDNKVFYVSDEGKLFDTENFTTEEIEAAEKEIKKYCEENSTYYEGTYYTFWDGSNWQTILLNTEFGHIDCDYEIIDDEEATEEIINDYHNSEFIEEVCGIIYYQGKKHKYSVSRWQGNPWSFEVED